MSYQSPLKKPFAKSMEAWSYQRAQDEIAKRGKALPASVKSITGSIVKVSLQIATTKTPPLLTVPMIGSQYARPPIQVGELGVVVPFDVLLGSVSGLGSSSPPTLGLMPANLGALVWTPISNTMWSEVDDPNAYCLYGPNGFRLRDTGNNVSIVGDTENLTLTAKTTLTLQVGAVSIVIDASGVTIEGKTFLTHDHTLVQTGSSNSGPVG